MSNHVVMRSPSTGLTYKIFHSKVISHLMDGWKIVDKSQQTYYQNQVQRIHASTVIHSHPST